MALGLVLLQSFLRRINCTTQRDGYHHQPILYTWKIANSCCEYSRKNALCCDHTVLSPYFIILQIISLILYVYIMPTILCKILNNKCTKNIRLNIFGRSFHLRGRRLLADTRMVDNIFCARNGYVA